MVNRVLYVVVAAMWFCSAANARKNARYTPVVHGTINIVLANENGFVVLTDSMLTSGSKQLREPGQKLFQLDDKTVCTIAGFVAASGGPHYLLYTSTGSIIRDYRQQLARKPPLSIDAKLTSLATLFRFYLSSVAIVRDVTGRTTLIRDYQLQLTVAGYDTDGKPKIGKITLQMPRNSLTLEIQSASISDVGANLIWSLAGEPDVAAGLLHNPRLDEGDTALQRYSTSLRENRGQSLTIREMEELASSLARHTANAYPSVGGPNQIAILQHGRVISVDQPAFPDSPKALLRYNLFVGDDFLGDSFSIGGTALFVTTMFSQGHLRLDGDYFFAGTFTQTTITYDGGFMYFDPTNKVDDCVLIIGPHAKRQSKTVRDLTRGFTWSRIVDERTGAQSKRK